MDVKPSYIGNKITR